MQLTYVQKQHFYTHGYVQVPGVVPQAMVDAAINVSPHVRYAIFFRLTHVEHAAHQWESMTDAWLEWEGMREIVAANQGAV